MKGFRKHPGRVTFRLFWFVWELIIAGLDFVVNVALQRRIPLAKARTLWLQQASRRMLRILGVQIHTEGTVPLRGLLVCNHLSYLDVLVLSAITPAVFISKSDVKQWPVFGWFAQMSGTLFVERTRRSDVTRLNREAAERLSDGALIVLFPEGTSTNGQGVLPFKSSLLEPVMNVNHPLTVGCIRYAVPDGDAREDVCYWGDMTLVPHLVNLMSKAGVRAHVAFSSNKELGACRKTLARNLHSEVVRMNSGELAEFPA